MTNHFTPGYSELWEIFWGFFLFLFFATWCRCEQTFLVLLRFAILLITKIKRRFFTKEIFVLLVISWQQVTASLFQNSKTFLNILANLPMILSEILILPPPLRFFFFAMIFGAEPRAPLMMGTVIAIIYQFFPYFIGMLQMLVSVLGATTWSNG